MIRILFLCILFCLVVQPPAVFAQDRIKTIVIFFGDNEARPAYSRIADGIKSSFPEGSETRINLISEYLDLERFSDSLHLQQVVDMYNNRVRTSSIDLVITVAPGAYDALRKFGLKLLRTTPVIAMEMSPQNPERYMPDTRVVELQVEWSPQMSMTHAFSLFPEKKNAYVIGGCSESDRMFSARLIRDADHFKHTHQFTFLSCVSIDSVLEIVKKLPDNSLVFMASFATDADNTPFSTALALPIISGQSRVPVFTISDNFINHGGVGGNIISFTEVGKEAGRIAGDLFKEDTLEGLTKIVKSYNRFQYNWEELKKWGLLNSKAIPSNSTFYHKEYDFYSEYRWQIMAVLLFILLQAFLISYLIRLLKEQKKVSAQKIQNEQLYRQLLREERLTTMALLTGSLAHELNQPLAAILFNTQAGLRFLQSGRLDEQLSKSILTDIEDDVRRASGIISSVRSMMKLETREKKNIEVNSLIRDVLNVLHTELRQHKVKVGAEESDQVLNVLGDEVELQQVLINLILNAVRAMKGNSPEDKVIQVKAKLINDLVTISVLDNGSGLSEIIQGKLFDPFVSTESDGMGIGLALCKSIIQRHGGEIRAENRPEGGAEFSFTLPGFNTRS